MNVALSNSSFSMVFGDVPDSDNPARFAQGQKDCKEGVEPSSSHPSYLGGYGFQYELEQIQSARIR